jgi:pimeloyl-ACP methyl ester carboxylesterase
MMFSSVGFKSKVEPQAMAQYKKPHPTPETRAGIAAFPKMIPNSERHENGAYIAEIDRRFEVVAGAGHYLQEDAGEQIAERMITFLRDEAKISA